MMILINCEEEDEETGPLLFLLLGLSICMHGGNYYES
jgi:hypothetical protein